MSSSGIAEPASKSPSDRVAGPRPIIIGGAVQDLLMRPFPGEALRLHTSNPGTVTASWGGVGRNIAEAAALLGASSPVLVTCVGNDAAGDELESYCAAVGVDLRSVTAAEGAPHPRTAVYAATLDGSGDLVAAVADMAAFDAIDAASLYDGELRGSSDASSAEEQGRRRLCDLIRESAAAAEVRIEPESDLGIVVDEGTSSSPSRAIVVVDGNVPAPGVRAAARLAAAAGDIDWARGSDAWVSSSPGSEDSDGSAAVTPEDVSVESLVFVYECTSVAKCVRAVEADALHLATLVKPNRLEVIALGDAWRARMGLPPVASVATEARADAQNAAAPAAASHVAAASPSAPPDASTTEQPDVDTSADDIIAGGSGERKRPRTADAARHAAYRGKGRQTRDREAGDGAAPSPAVVTQSVYFDRASEPAAADASRGRLLGQHSYALPGDAASSSAGEGPAADPLVLSVYEEFGAEAAAATKAVGGAADIGGGEPASAAGSEGAGSADAAHAGTSLDYEVLAAAQAVLAAMVRPGVSAEGVVLETPPTLPPHPPPPAGPAGSPGGSCALSFQPQPASHLRKARRRGLPNLRHPRSRR